MVADASYVFFFFGIVHNHFTEWHETTKFVIALLL